MVQCDVMHPRTREDVKFFKWPKARALDIRATSAQNGGHLKEENACLDKRRSSGVTLLLISTARIKPDKSGSAVVNIDVACSETAI